MIDHLPPSLRGLMLAAFAAAYMSTIATQLNWGASYIVNDFYRRFVRPHASDRHYVRRFAVGHGAADARLRGADVLHDLDQRSVEAADRHRRGHGRRAAAALVLVANQRLERSLRHDLGLRGVASLQTIGGLDSDKPEQFAWLMLITVAVTTVVWLAVTFLTAPEKQEMLIAFYRRTRPGKAGWQPIARLAPEAEGASNHLLNLLDWFCGCVLVLGILFGTGKFLLGETAVGLALTAVGLAAGGVVYWDLTRRGWKSVVDSADPLPWMSAKADSVRRIWQRRDSRATEPRSKPLSNKT